MKRRKKIDYSNRDLTNPFFQRRRKKKFRLSSEFWSWRKKLIIFEIIVLAAGLIWFTCFSTVFTIEETIINGSVRIPSQEIKNLTYQQAKTKRFLLFSQNNLIIFNKKELIETLKESYCFEKLTVSKHLPHTLILNIQEKSYAFIWREADKYYYADIDGYLINEINPLEIKQKKYPLIHNQAEERIINDRKQGGIGKINIDNSYLNYIMDLFNEFSAKTNLEEEGDSATIRNYQGLTIEKFIIDKDVNTIKMAIVEGPTIYFNSNEDREKQIKKLFVIKEEKLKDDFENKTYIDLRYGDRVYYR